MLFCNKSLNSPSRMEKEERARFGKYVLNENYETPKNLEEMEDDQKVTSNEGIGEEIFRSICYQIEEEESVRKSINKYILRGKGENGRIDLVYEYGGPFVNGTGIRHVNVPCLKSTNTPNYTHFQVASSFGEEILPHYKIEHPECEGYEVVLEYSTSYMPWNIFKPTLHIYVREIPRTILRSRWF